MAVNYTFAQAVKVLKDMDDLEAVQDITRRFPIASIISSKVVAEAGDDFLKLLDVMPEYLTMRKVESGFKHIATVGDDGADDVDVDVEAEDEPEKPAPKKRARKAKAEEPAEEPEDDGDGEYAGKNAMELFKICKSRKLKAQPKKPAKYYIDILEKDDAAKAEEPAADDTEDDDDDWDI